MLDVEQPGGAHLGHGASCAVAARPCIVSCFPEGGWIDLDKKQSFFVYVEACENVPGRDCHYYRSGD